MGSLHVLFFVWGRNIGSGNKTTVYILCSGLQVCPCATVLPLRQHTQLCKCGCIEYCTGGGSKCLNRDLPSCCPCLYTCSLHVVKEGRSIKHEQLVVLLDVHGGVHFNQWLGLGDLGVLGAQVRSELESAIDLSQHLSGYMLV